MILIKDCMTDITINKNIISAQVMHYGIYMVVDKKIYSKYY